MDTTKEFKYQRAKEKVKNIRSFYGNLMAYAMVIPLLGLLNYNTTSFPWVLFPALGWGIGLVGHGFSAFGYMPFLGQDWEQRKIQEYMNSDRF